MSTRRRRNSPATADPAYHPDSALPLVLATRERVSAPAVAVAAAAAEHLHVRKADAGNEACTWLAPPLPEPWRRRRRPRFYMTLTLAPPSYVSTYPYTPQTSPGPYAWCVVSAIGNAHNPDPDANTNPDGCKSFCPPISALVPPVPVVVASSVGLARPTDGARFEQHTVGVLCDPRDRSALTSTCATARPVLWVIAILHEGTRNYHIWYAYLAYILRGPHVVSYSEKPQQLHALRELVMDAGHASQPPQWPVLITRSSDTGGVGDLQRPHELRGAMMQ